MKMKFLSVILCLVILSNKGYSQNTDLPQLLPPTPEAASIIRTGMGNVNYSTGAVTASVPLYEFKNGPIKLAVGLSYQTQGLKVEELAGRVGLGWALHAGGVVTKSVHGRPDEISILQPIPANVEAESASNLTYLNQATYVDPFSTFDTEPDEFFFSFNGYSGKFILDVNRTPILISKDNLKVFVDPSINNIYITTPDGIKYSFGGTNATESTLSLSTNYKIKTKTSFYLYNIKALSGQEINFNYTPITISSSIGLSQTIAEISPSDPGERYVLDPSEPIPECTSPGIVSDNFQSQWIVYSSYYLSGITTSTGQSAIFTYEAKNDLSNDVRLKFATFMNDGFALKKYQLSYYDQPNVSGIATPDGGITKNGRHFLTQIDQVDNENNINTKLLYKFEYNSLYSISTSLYSQDFMGFNNSNPANTLIREIPTHPGYTNANRSPDWNRSVQGTLSKITFPTGGIEEFEYEANTVDTVEKLNTITNYTFLNSGIVSDGFATVHNVTYDYPNILVSQTVHLKMKTYVDPAYAGTINYPSPLTKVMYVKITNLNTMAVVFNNYVEDLAEKFQDVALAANYRIEVEVRGPSYIKGEVSFMYDYAAAPIYVRLNKEAPGVRLKKLTSIDPVTKQVLHKHYIYAALATLSRSSGYGPLTGPYLSQNRSIQVAHPNFTICTQQIYSSNSGLSVYDFDGSHIYYKNIIEVNDLNFANGGTEYVFFDPVISADPELAFGNLIPGLPHGTFTVLNGMKKALTVFDNNKNIISKQVYDYENIAAGTVFKSLAVSKHFAVPTWLPPVIHYPDLRAFDIVRYEYRPGWIRLHSTTSTQKDINNNELVTSTVYGYGTTGNINVKTTTTINSKGAIIINEKKYPNDFGSHNVSALMVNKNIVSPVIEETVTLNGVQQTKTHVEYKDWFSDGKVIVPEIIQAKLSPSAPILNKIIFHDYGHAGNVKQVSKSNDINLSYIWDYNGSSVIAEIKNAAAGQVAYTSFEDNSYGNWIFNSGSSGPGGVTGFKSFSGSLSFTPQSTAKAIVSLWSKTMAAMFHVNAGVLQTTKGDWKLLKWVLISPATVTVSGNDIDELRLYPESASINTYTYYPSIGINTASDDNNKIIYYKYDAFNRLKLVLDIDKNIIKQNTYTYKDVILPCTNTVADWVNTGTERCVKNSNNNNTGIKETEQKDFNNCSITYLQTRWVSAGASAACPVVANCTGADKRVVNGVCEAGTKMLISSVKVNANTWNCTYHYLWSDGFTGPDFIETGNAPCFFNAE